MIIKSNIYFHKERNTKNNNNHFPRGHLKDFLKSQDITLQRNFTKECQKAYQKVENAFLFCHNTTNQRYRLTNTFTQH